MGEPFGDGSVRNDVTASVMGPLVQVGRLAGDLRLALPRQETPWQVPAASPRFVDRAGLLAELHGLPVDDPARILVLGGLPGVGKQAVARRWADEARGRFPGGSLYVDCLRFAAPSGVVDVDAMLACCLRGFGLEDRYIPGDRGDRENLLRTRTAERPVLIVVANATEAAQVVPMVPAARGSVLLVTSDADMSELSMDGARFYDLAPLDDEHGAELFRRVCGSPPAPAARDLLRLCAGLPIAILVVAARLASRAGPTAAELAGELADESRRLAALATKGTTNVSAAFTASYERLPQDARRLYRRLGVLPVADVTAAVAAVAAGVDERTADGLLRTLAGVYLVEPAGGRYSLHPLVRLHARERAAADEPAEQIEATVYRVVRHYLAHAAFADRALRGDRLRITDHATLLSGLDDPYGGADEARAWLDGERANLVAVTRAACEEGWDAETWQLAEALTAYYPDHRHLEDWIITGDLGARAARRCGAPAAEARLRSMLSRPYTDRGELDRARVELDIAAGLAERHGGLALRASVEEFRGRYLEHTDPGAALGAYARSRDLNADAGEWRGVGLATYFAGRTLGVLGRHTESLTVFGRARDLLRWCGDSRMASRVLIGIGGAQAHLGRAAEAVATLERAAEELAGRHYEAEARELLAALAGHDGDRAAAERHLRRAVQIYAAEGNPRAESLVAEVAGSGDVGDDEGGLDRPGVDDT